MRRGADWFAWILQFVFGLLVGAFLGFASISKGRRNGGGVWLLAECIPTYLVGAALIGAALASFHGDKLWLGSFTRVIPPDGIRHSGASRIVSILAGVIGGILCVIAIIRHFWMMFA